MNNNDKLANAMNPLSYRHTVGQLLTRHMMPGLMPAQPASIRPQATFNAPLPAPVCPSPAAPGLRTDIAQMPATCGVYILRGSNDLPLFVGRSINLRSRVQAHLDEQPDALLMPQASRVEYRRSAGELGAMLMEASLRRQLQPLHNKKLRTKRCLHTLRLDGAGQVVVAKVAAHDFSRAENLFGIFASQHAAQEALQRLVAQHGLCDIHCGLEPATTIGQACFGRQIRRCRGACTGEESLASHHARLMQALEELRILPWPYAGPMGIVERADDGWVQVHVVDHWRYLGSLDEQHRRLPGPLPMSGGFDLDSYKMIIRPYLLGQLEWRALPALHS